MFENLYKIHYYVTNIFYKLIFLTYFTMSMKQDFVFVCPKFWKTFKNEVSPD